MPLTFVADQYGRSQLVLTAVPDFVIALPIAPPELDACVKEGKWLVVAMSVWNVYDIRTGQRAIDVVQRHEGVLRLGMRPFDHPEENTTWIPVSVLGQPGNQHDVYFSEEQDGKLRSVTIQGNVNESPMWATFSSGNLVELRRGQLSDAEIEEMIVRLLTCPMN